MGRAPELSACCSLGLRGHTSVLGVCVSLLLLRKRLCVKKHMGFPGVSHGKEDPLEKGMVTHSMDREARQAIVHGVPRVRHNCATNTFTFQRST